jgi:hypothetical protein
MLRRALDNRAPTRLMVDDSTVGTAVNCVLNWQFCAVECYRLPIAKLRIEERADAQLKTWAALRKAPLLPLVRRAPRQSHP